MINSKALWDERVKVAKMLHQDPQVVEKPSWLPPILYAADRIAELERQLADVRRAYELRGELLLQHEGKDKFRPMQQQGFGIRRIPPCSDCDGPWCTMNCNPKQSAALEAGDDDSELR